MLKMCLDFCVEFLCVECSCVEFSDIRLKGRRLETETGLKIWKAM